MKRAGKKKPSRQRPLIEEVEPRILYSADVSPLSVPPPPLAEQRSLDTGGEFVAPASIAQSAAAVEQSRHEIVFVDTNTPDYQKLVDAVQSQSTAQCQIEVVLLDAKGDGIKQISSVLANQTNLSAVHLISHGIDGQVELGATSLNFDSLLQNATQIKGWGQSLSADADLLIYGCDVAQAADGKGLMDALSRLTGADVAASENLTGAANLGGDWTLEYKIGQIDTQLAVSDADQVTWGYTLSTYTVSNTDDAGAGSLRQAITDANAIAGTNTVAFNIVGAGVQTITLASALPEVTRSVVLDGWSQGGAGYAGSPLIEINGNNAVSDGLVISAGDSTVRGLIINRVTGDAIRLSTNGNNTIVGNWIGTDNTGAAIPATRVGGDGIEIQSGGNTIGGSGTGEGNVISGATGHGVNITGVSATGNVLLGNYIGLDAAGSAAVGNQGYGVMVQAAATGNIIGGLTAADRNVISGNLDHGVNMIGVGTSNNEIIGNYVGLDATGTSAIGNADGAQIASGATDNTIGGIAAGARNIISGNIDDGIEVNDAGTSNNVIQGNYIGLNAAGTAAVSNGDDGIAVGANASNTIIGGSAAGAGNVISGNTTTGIGAEGILISGATGTVIQGNIIGLNPTRTTAFGNSGNGIRLTGTPTTTTIGGTGAGAGNTIAFSGLAGVLVETGTGNAILGNSIYSNTGLGIDLDSAGVLVNDGAGDPDAGANDQQNYPVLSSASSSGGTISIAGSLTSANSNTYRIEFFASTTGDATNGEGERYLGFMDVTTDASGIAIFTANLSGALTPGQLIIAATATDVSWNTSEFAANITGTIVNSAPTGTDNTISTLEDSQYTFAAVDFGFTDPNDAPSNALSAIKISAIPGAGSLTLSGVAVTAGQTISVANLDSGELKFAPAVNGNGTGYASFSFQVQDDGGTANAGVDLDTSANTMTVNITAANDAPAGSNNAVTSLEDSAYSFVAADFGFSDTADSPANNLSAVTIASVPAAGSLTLSGLAVSAGQSITLADIVAGNLQFSPSANASGAAYASFTFQVQDDGGTANGGVDLDQTPNTITVNVSAVNDAPAGSSNSVTTPEDTAYTFAVADFGFSDASDSPTNNLSAVAIATIPGAGSLMLSGVAVIAGQIISASDIVAGNLTFVAAADANGAGYASFSFQVQDDGGTANGGVDLDASPNSMTVNVTAVNDAPAGTNKTVATLEDTAYTFATADFGFSDASDSPANALSSVKITTIPAAGSLTLSAVAVTAGQSITAANIAAGSLKFTPATNANGASYASFTFQVEDDGGTANGGVNLDASSNTIAVNVTSVDDAPAGTSNTVTTLEDSAYTFTSADFGFTDPNDSPANNLSAVKITTVPGAGSLALSGVAVTAGQTISLANIAAGNLKFTSVANANGAGYSSFMFQVEDDGGTANGGVNLDASPNTITVNVTSVNDAPAGTNNTVTTLEDTAYTFATADFGFSDASDSPANALSAVKITTIPAAGSLTLSAVAVTAGQGITAANIAAGSLKFTPATNANGASYASFSFQVQDDGGTANAGVDLDASPNSMTVNVTAVNDAPAGTNKTVATLEDTAYTFAAADFGFSDASDSPANALSSVKITTIPGAGSLTLSAVAVMAGQSITAANIAAGDLKFTPAANANGASYASFTFQVEDDGGTANGGVNLDASPNTITVNVTSVNDAPAGTNNTVTTLEDTAYTFGTADFGFTDASDSPANALSSVKITTIPAAGSLTLSAVAVTAGQSITAANIAAGSLKFTPATNANGASYATFTFQVQDDGGTGNGGVDLDASSNTIAVNVTSVDDAPAGTSNTVTTLEDSAYTFTSADFGFTDPNDSPANNLSAVKITTVPGAGSLALSGVAVTAGQTISLANIAAGNLKFTSVANANGAGYSSFMFQVEDDGGTANGGVDLDASPNTMTINVTAVNDEPTLSGANNLIAINEDPASNPGTLVSALIAGQVSDVDAGAASGIAVTAVDNTYGTWQYSTNGGGAWSNFGAPSELSARLLAADASSYVRFLPNASWNGTVSNGLSFRAWDQTSGTAGGTADSGFRTVLDNFAVTSYSNNNGTSNWSTSWVETDASGGGASSGSIKVNGPSMLWLKADNAGDGIYREVNLSGASFATLSFSYNNHLNNTGSIALQVSSNGGGGYTTLATFSNSSNTGAGTKTFDVSSYIAANARVRFYVIASDSGGPLDLDNVQIEYKLGSGTAVSTASASCSITVNSVNDAPAGTSKTVTTLEDSAYTFASADFGFSDPNDSPANNLSAVKVTAIPGAGSLTWSGVAITAGQTISAATIIAGSLKFTPGANANGAGYASFTFQVQDDGGSANGGVDLDASPNTMTVNVTAVNDTPAGTNNTVTTLEDIAYTFATADFGFSDPNDSPANALSAVKITTIPGAGSLTLSAVAITAGQSISAANIAAGNLKFIPTTNANGASYASFTFQVKDDGGTVNGGVDLDASPNTITVNVTSVNDAPAGTNNTVTTLEDTAYTFATADFGFSDPNDSPANALSAVKITTIPGAGSLTLSAVAITAGQSITTANIVAGNLKFTAAANANGPSYATFTFQVEDDGPTANGGVDLDASPNTITVNVTSVNDAPAGTNNTVTTLEDTAYTFGTADFGFTDASDSLANALSSVKITTIPGAGSLTLSTVAVTTGQSITAANIAAGSLKFTPATNANGASYASFTVQVQDDGGTANGGVDLDQTPNTITVNVTGVNDAPAGTNNSVTTIEDTAYSFAAVDFGLSDASDTPANNLTAVTITTIPGSGNLTLSGVAVVAGQSISAASIAAGDLQFSPAANASGAGYASFSFQVQDDGGSANGGVNLDATPNTITVNVTAVNDAPAGSDNTISTLEDSAYTFAAVDFGFSEAADSPANNLAAVQITTPPGAGSLTLLGVAVSAGQSISVASIAAGSLQFMPAANASGAGYASFSFQVQDDGGTANGGVDLDQTPNTITVEVTAVNDAPTGSNNTVTTLEDSAYTFAAMDFGFGDAADTPANNLAAVQITTLPGAGSLTLLGVAVSAGQSISAASIAAGDLKFAPAADANGAGYASFTFSVQDDGGSANGGLDLDASPNTMTVNVTGVNDAPAGTNNSVTTIEDTAYSFAAVDFGLSDASDTPANNLTAVTITTIPGSGNLTLSGVAVVAGQSISAASIAAGDLQFSPAANASGAGYASFSFQVQDDGGSANDGVNLDATPNTITVNVTAVNDAPAGSDNMISTLEDSAYTFAAVDFGFSDAADMPANNLAAVQITTLPGAGSLTLLGVAVSAGQSISVASIAAGDLKFAPAADANGAGYASFTFSVQDDGGSANGGLDLDASPNTMTVNVTGVNDAPAGTNNSVTTIEDTAYSFAAVDFGLSDASDTPANNLTAVTITTIPGSGNLTLSGVAVVAGQSISAASIAAGDLKFAPAADANGAGYASFTFSVQDDGGSANGGLDLDASPNTMTVNVTGVNDAPAGTNNSVTTIEDTAYSFAAVDFGLSDASDAPANNLTAVTVTTIPGSGNLTLSGVAVVAGQSISAANIAAGDLQFMPAANASGAGYASFSFQVQDDGGTLNGGVDLDPVTRTLTIDVSAVDDAPVIVQNTMTLSAGASVTLSGAQLSATDVDDPAAGLLFSVSGVVHGQFELASGPTIAIMSFSQAQISGGQVRFVHDASTSAPSYDVSVSDGMLSAGPAAAGISFSVNGAGITSPPPGPVLPPSPPSLPGAPPVPLEPAPQPAPIPSADGDASTNPGTDGGSGGGGGDGLGADGGAGSGVGVLDTQSAVVRPARVEVRGVALAQVQLSSGVHELHSGIVGIVPVDLSILLQSSDLQYTSFGGTAQPDWSITSAFKDDTTLKQKDQFSVLLDSSEMGGIALSVGVVWWASRVTGVIGSLLASMPAWRQLDPLSVVGTDEDAEEFDWQSEGDRYADADELAISMMLEGPRTAATMRA